VRASATGFGGSASDPTSCQLLAAADIYCQPNLDPEPFGIAFVEALAAGCRW
jgi:glycosyltransferase involved in cell wall biosynthesis